jgi:hypothetical protein
MTDQEEAELLEWGDQEAKRQMLETLITLDPVAYEQFMYVKDRVYANLDLADFVQHWREVYE